MFVLSLEGSNTERQYFDRLNKMNSSVVISCLPGGTASSPNKVLARMKKYLERKDYKHPYEAWIVIDKDQWTDKQLQQLHDWQNEKDNYGFALSNPKFEYWLLLHFEDGKGMSSTKHCDDRLEKHLPNYKKSDISSHKFTQENIKTAINHARKYDTPPCLKWPQNNGTTVYKVVEKILNHTTKI